MPTTPLISSTPAGKYTHQEKKCRVLAKLSYTFLFHLRRVRSIQMASDSMHQLCLELLSLFITFCRSGCFTVCIP